MKAFVIDYVAGDHHLVRLTSGTKNWSPSKDLYHPMGSASVWLLSLVLCWGLPSLHTTLSYAAVYYVTPHSPNPDCPSGEPCLTLNEYTQGDHFDGEDNITLLFLNGEHNLATYFNISQKTSLRMVPSSTQAKVLIQLATIARIVIQHTLEVDISELKIISQSAERNSIPACLSFSDIGLLSVTSISVEFCQLSLQGKVKATITDLIANTTAVHSLLTINNHTVTIRKSYFFSSILNISDSLASQISSGDIITSALNLENSSMENSLLTVTLQTPIVYELSILDTSIYTNQHDVTMETGIKAKTLNSTLNVLLKNCSYIGNYQGIGIYAGGNSSIELSAVKSHITDNGMQTTHGILGIGITAAPNTSAELNIDQCYIANNGYGVGIERLFSTRSDWNQSAVTMVNITSSKIINNYLGQVGVDVSKLATAVTIFNSTIQSIGKYGAISFNVGPYTTKCMFLNLTQNHIVSNTTAFSIGAYDVGEIDSCISEVHFTGNSVISPGTDESYGVSVYEATIIMTITDCLFRNQGTAINFHHSQGTVVITETVFLQTNNGITVDLDYSSYRPVINVMLLITGTTFQLNSNGITMQTYNSASTLHSVTLLITETTFLQNSNGIIVDLLTPNVMIDIKDSLFQENNGVSLGVLTIKPYVYSLTPESSITLNNVTFFNNTTPLPNIGIVQVGERFSLSIGDSCVFRGNHGTSVKANSTTVTLSGTVIFENNVALQGGAISMKFSMLTLRSINSTNTTIWFMNNTAKDTGGGIYVDQPLSIDSATGSSCFYDLQGVSIEELKNSAINLVFIDNKAINGGNDIYGRTPNSHCPITIANGDNSYTVNSTNIQQEIFRLSSSLSSISSDPKRVCLCDSSSQLMCANLSFIFYNTTRYPGEVFSLPLAVVGFEFGTVTGLVYSNLLPQADNFMSSLGAGGVHVTQVIIQNASIALLNFTVNSNNPWETVVLTVNDTRVSKPGNHSYISSLIQSFNKDRYHLISTNLLTTFVYINVSLLRCPLGFQLSDQGRCECATALQEFGISDCLIYNNIPYITRSGNQWVYPTPDNGIISSKHCPFNYCKHETMMLNFNDPDDQCALNHTGILCGGCPSNLSLAIGSSRCLECSDNYHILLLLVFSVAGILLVLFIKILDITVAAGTINGLIFYANIIWANQSVLFPPQSETYILLKFLKTFIAWLNLDLGIETCFIQGLDGYWKTWLQFAFPAYIWLIASLIILVSHYSIRATTIFGNNSVPVLATLFLLSYAKLLRTVLITLEFTVLEYSSHDQTLAWSFDGKIPYFSLEHSFLFAGGLTVLLVLWLPYTFALFFIQCLRRYSHYRLLRWVNKLKPLFDSYLGPLKAKHHYWIGLGLLARLVLLLTSAATLTIIPTAAALLITITASLLGLLVTNVYQQWQLGALEGCFLVNMVLFSSGALFIDVQGGSKDSLAWHFSWDYFYLVPSYCWLSCVEKTSITKETTSKHSKRLREYR